MSAVRLYALGAALAALLTVIAVDRLDLAPPDRVAFAAGRQGGGYHAVATRYREILAEDGIAVEIVETDGSVENAALLASGRADIALLQGGVPVPEGDGPAQEAIAALFFEPVLIVMRDAAELSAFPPDWEGRAIAVGPEGSGARFAFHRLAAAAGLDPAAVAAVALGGAQAAEALLAGEVDAALFVAPVQAPYLQRLVGAEGLSILSLENRDALARRLPELMALDLPAGSIDYAGRAPAAETALLAAPARLVGRADLHPALVNRLVRAARILHAPPDLLSEEGDFPTQRAVDMPLNPYAGALLRDGPPMLEEVLPYWVAAQVNRFVLLLLPLFLVALPLMRAAPGLYDWLVRRRIYSHYRALREIDIEAARTEDPATLDRLAGELDAVEASLRSLRVPLPFRDQAFLAQSHLELVRRRIDGRRSGG